VPRPHAGGEKQNKITAVSHDKDRQTERMATLICIAHKHHISKHYTKVKTTNFSKLDIT